MRRPAATAIVLLFAIFLFAVIFTAGCGNKESGQGGGAGDGSQGRTDSTDAGSQARTDGAAMTGFTLTSKDFTDGGELPRTRACASQGGDNESPALAWSGAPAETARYALVVDDEDPPCGSGDGACRHWSVFDLPAGVTSLKAGQDILQIAGASEGVNYLGQTGYAGPCPPSRHTYNFTVYALGRGMPEAGPGAALNRSQFESLYGSHILGSATIRATFSP